MPGPQNTRTYSYSRYDISFHNNAKEYEDARIAGDWDVSKVLGRWELRVHPEDGLSNPVEIKIDKRAQIVNTAQTWAGLNLTDNEYPVGSGVAWACSAFTDRLVYEPLGLPSDSDLNANNMASDFGDGALVFFWGKNVPVGTGSANHVAIRVGSSRIDANARLQQEPPTVRGLLDFANDYLPEPFYPYWGTVVVGAPKDKKTGLSILKELDDQ